MQNSTPSLVAQIDAWLPQTQCTQCGYPRCRDYAEALATGRADINQCPPGGDITIAGLAQLLDRDEKPLDPANGLHRPRTRAVIDEAHCIGCTLCIEACPVDAIVGANKRMHTVIAALCTGCELCVPPCPVDCIDLVAAKPGSPPDRWPEYGASEVRDARQRCERRLRRLRDREDQQALRRQHQRLRRPGAADLIRRAISQAVSRTRSARRNGPGPQ